MALAMANASHRSHWRNQLSILAAFIGGAFPRVNRELREWEQLAQACPEGHLQQQALASLHLKKFHCQGGSIFTTRTPGPYRDLLARAIVALQTISDYLDNLCDRAGVQDTAAFTQLHRAFLDAVDPEAHPEDYYSLYPYHEDGGYLKRLVGTCQEILASFPAYPQVKKEIQRLAGYYCRLQVTKHLHPLVRDEQLRGWLEPLATGYAQALYWWELAAACGSTLGIFALMHLATRTDLEATAVQEVGHAYFPWIGGLHILLDYYIDQEEDLEGGDFNFTACYPSLEEATGRLQWLLRKSLELARGLPDPVLHVMVVEGLPAMYLSDPKAATTALAGPTQQVLAAAGPGCRRLHRTCTALRRAGVI